MLDRRDFLKYLGVAGAGAALFNVNLASAARPQPRLPAQPSSNQINILFDSWSTQVMVQQLPSTVNFPASFTPSPDYNTGLRLNTILGAMQSFGFGKIPPTSSNRAWKVSYTTPPITPDQLAGADVYVSLTRMQGDDFAYTTDELTHLSNFVSNDGKGILLMTNHGPLPDAPNDNYTKNDAALAKVFFNIQLQPYYVTLNNDMVMDVNNQDSALQYIANQVTAIVAHDSCVIVPPNAPFNSIAKFPIGAQAYNSVTGKWTTPPASPHFSIMVPYGAGKVIVVGNSGMIGDYGSPYPAAGIIPLENNLMFFLNCVGYLAGFNCIPQPGQGPCANASGINIGAIDLLLQD
jgi:hypothetical protein